jgi:hypothetical protein
VLVGRLCVPFPSAGREKPKSFVAFRLACHGTVSLPRLCRPVLCRAHWRNCQVFTRAGLALFFDLTAVSLWLQAMFFLPLFVFGLSRMRLGRLRCLQPLHTRVGTGCVPPRLARSALSVGKVRLAVVLRGVPPGFGYTLGLGYRGQPGLHFRGLGLVRALGVLRLGRRSWLWHLSSCAVDCAFPAYNLVVAIVGRRACVVGVWRDSSLHLALQPAYAGLAGFERGAGS